MKTTSAGWRIISIRGEPVERPGECAEFWDGPMVIKGILDPEDARDAVRFGADGMRCL
ncbi:alpha-hydroxy-acid oxidizing protein [Shigella flexneri]